MGVIPFGMRLVMVLAVMACSGSRPNQPAPASPSPPASPNPPAAAAPAPPAPADEPQVVTAEGFCERLATLATGCGAFSKFSMPPEQCLREARTILGREPRDPQAMTLLTCVARSNGCDATVSCLNDKFRDPVADAPLRACGNHSGDALLSAVGIPRAEWERRKGAGVTTYRAAMSTKASPVEMCGVPAANQWLATLACDNGTRPITDPHSAEVARAGSVGPGGRCGSIIDHYVVACPEAHYDIFIDPYVCAQRD